jgi:hypothetical protein
MLRSSVAESSASPKANPANGEKPAVIYAVRYFWRLAKGHRLRPWRSPLVRWRFETFFGLHADQLTARQFFGLLWRHQKRMGAFLRWAEEMESKGHRVKEPKSQIHAGTE